MGKNLTGISRMTAMITVALTVGHSVAAEPASPKKPVLYQTQVIEDRGGQPIAPYLPKNTDTSERMNKTFEERRSKKLIHAHFPVVTNSMSVGKVTEDEAKDLRYQMASRPLFIVGYDPVSKNWLASNKELLKAKRAIGMVVNVQTKEQMTELQAIVGDGVLMQPTPGDRMSEHLKIRHYPFYMDSQGAMR